MKALLPPQRALAVLWLMGVFTGRFQVLCLEDIPFTMFNDSVDDQYLGCSHTRDARLQQQGSIPLEKKYHGTWERARQHLASLGQKPSHFNPIHETAIVAYTVGDDLYRDFNEAVRGARESNSSYQQFAFKDFHFLLTRAVQARKEHQRGCHKVFRGIHGKRFTVSEKVVRFGQFASSSLEKREAQRFGEDSFFIINTCLGVQIDDISLQPNQKEVLIPPYETFTVAEHSENEKGVLITLEHQGNFSRFNCEVENAAGLSLSSPTGMPFLLWGLLLALGILGPLGSL